MPANTWVMRIWEHNLKLGCFVSLYNQISPTDLPNRFT